MTEKCMRCQKFFEKLEVLDYALEDWKGILFVCKTCYRKLSGEEVVQFT